MSEFTSGVWKLDKKTGEVYSGGARICQVYGATEYNMENNVTECFANAKLIMNAPKLYLILKPLFMTKSELRFSEVMGVMMEIRKVVDAIDAKEIQDDRTKSMMNALKVCEHCVKTPKLREIEFMGLYCQQYCCEECMCTTFPCEMEAEAREQWNEEN
jgi:hypothetical protein